MEQQAIDIMEQQEKLMAARSWVSPDEDTIGRPPEFTSNKGKYFQQNFNSLMMQRRAYATGYMVCTKDEDKEVLLAMFNRIGEQLKQLIGL